MEQLSFNQNIAWQQSVMPGLVPEYTAPKQRTVIRTRRKPDVESPAPAGNVTEIILPEGQVENFQLLLPMLTQLNQEKRWLAWIDPPQALVSKWQKMHGIITGELLVLRSTAEYPARQLAEIALSAGTCHAVVMWTGKLGKTAFASLQEAAAKGNSHGVVLRQR
ncbi:MULTISPECIES: cell division inhibitor SulA [Marinobacter]|uniref:SulA-like leucine-rich domain-containing protein n=1 Tax=Marinobacter xiaoshiensis TaxID=3073652 RepID=A0ABU2HEQ7_9GAMM|nr:MULTISPECIES: SulA-like leucine-rich domain-containing protein [unclassified Marinobacter]MBK1872119.1 LexA family transcriptional regulator [Marinobacter sp. 1-3A]MBK1885503.1 LexA family transcriptional regulator [Marinobacter sp. DY40_1A1]MDS1309547.1 SulA-like leucine-rich domain-containing protein [Marinobacter sp. F60267]